MPNFSETFKDLSKIWILMVFKKTPYSLTLKEKNPSGIFRRIVGGTDHLNQIEFPGPFLFLE